MAGESGGSDGKEVDIGVVATRPVLGLPFPHVLSPHVGHLIPVAWTLIFGLSSLGECWEEGSSRIAT